MNLSSFIFKRILIIEQFRKISISYNIDKICRIDTKICRVHLFRKLNIFPYNVPYKIKCQCSSLAVVEIDFSEIYLMLSILDFRQFRIKKKNGFHTRNFHKLSFLYIFHLKLYKVCIYEMLWYYSKYLNFMFYSLLNLNPF